MAELTLEMQEYEALIALARAGTDSPDKTRQLEAFLRNIEKKNGINRDALWLQWTEANQPLPPSTRFPDTWPPTQRRFIELTTRKVSRADCEAVLSAHAVSPVDVMVTRDVGARVGWTQIDSFFLTG